mgnify:CR=1 FL=1|jgi:hypothetical protein
MHTLTINGTKHNYTRRGRFLVAPDGFRTMKMHRLRRHLSGDRFPAHKKGR